MIARFIRASNIRQEQLRIYFLRRLLSCSFLVLFLYLWWLDIVRRTNEIG
ncbi:predicted protein [Plenodomus lingam JN3]|uniref:Predicted protein n=1 Tax=Leptosphaeria maculans (strain JN3 / isolate v23.1.3 / race Av1-4-5-6-7-8) TaxID=985895 RepID=E4ZWC9_LEPMJ|nr:predicted protein [Plenodomus lingam JN3]CBX95905.1 predicted protein [Plenodomus lingam JN3]